MLTLTLTIINLSVLANKLIWEMARISIETSYSVFTRFKYVWSWLHLFHKLSITTSNNAFIIDGNSLIGVIRWKSIPVTHACNCASHALFILNFSFLEIISLSLSLYYHLPFDSIAIASAMRTRWSIANIKHSLVIVFSITFSCLLYNIPLGLSDSILLRLPAASDSSSTATTKTLL